MEFLVVNALHFESRRETKVPVWKAPTAEDMHLWLHWESGPFWNTIKADAVVLREKGIVAVSETARRLFRVEASAK